MIVRHLAQRHLCLGIALAVACLGLAVADPAAAQPVALPETTGLDEVTPDAPGVGPDAPSQDGVPPPSLEPEDAEPPVPTPSGGFDPEGPILPVSHLEIRFELGDRGLPQLDDLLPITLELSRTASGGLAPPRDGSPAETFQLGDAPGRPTLPLHASAIGSVSKVLLAGYRERGLIGVYVEPSSADIDFRTEEDLRSPGNTALVMIVSVGRVREVRTVASGQRVDAKWRINNKLHRRIRRDSPLRPADVLNDETTDLLREDLLEDYLFRLNRHPGRRVDASVAASEDGRGAAVDYLIHEAKPWTAYVQGANTGTDNTGRWQERFGFTNLQLTNRDDIFSVEYLTAGFQDLHAVRASYEGRSFDWRRPDWLKSKSHDSGLLAMVPRDLIPWWGAQNVRWRLEGGWGQYTASDVGSVNEQFKGQDWSVGGNVAWNFFQHKALFLDLVGGLRFRNVSVDRKLVGSGGEGLFMLPFASLRLERKTDTSYLRVMAGIEGSASSALGTTDGDASDLGRLNAEADWGMIRWNAQLSQFLEPLLNRKRWADPSTRWSSTLAHEIVLSARGQYAFDYRLIPQAEQVVGGLFSVRGYPQSIAVGDSVYMGSAEYRFHLGRALPFYSKPIPVPWIGDFRVTPQQTYGSADWDLIFRGFVDTAYSQQNGPLTSGRIEGDEFLLGVGVGLELRLRRNIGARIDWGTALKDVDRGNGRFVKSGDHQLHFVFSVLY